MFFIWSYTVLLQSKFGNIFLIFLVFNVFCPNQLSSCLDIGRMYFPLSMEAFLWSCSIVAIMWAVWLETNNQLHEIKLSQSVPQKAWMKVIQEFVGISTFECTDFV